MALFRLAEGPAEELLESSAAEAAVPAIGSGRYGGADEGGGDGLAAVVGFNEAVLIGRILYRLILLGAAMLYLIEHMNSGCRVASF